MRANTEQAAAEGRGAARETQAQNTTGTAAAAVATTQTHVVPLAGGWSPTLVLGALLLLLLAAAAGAFAAASLVVTPALRSLEEASRAMELAAVETERAMNVTAYDMPRTLEDISAASREWEMLGRELREGGSGLLKAWYNTRKGSEDVILGLTSGATNATIGGAEAAARAARSSIDALSGSLTSALDAFTRATVLTRSQQIKALRAARLEEQRGEARMIVEDERGSGDADDVSAAEGEAKDSETAAVTSIAVAPEMLRIGDPVESALAAAENAAIAAADASARLDRALREARSREVERKNASGGGGDKE